jgi:hypothetical protein
MPYLNKIQPGKLAVKASWFVSVRDRIEEIAPEAGQCIVIKQQVEKTVIGVDIDCLKSNLGLNEITLNVCENGEPATLIVYGPEGQ